MTIRDYSGGNLTLNFIENFIYYTVVMRYRKMIMCIRMKYAFISNCVELFPRLGLKQLKMLVSIIVYVNL